MTIPSNHPELLVQAHRNSTSGYGNYNGLSVINPDHHSLAFDEPPPPYPNNSPHVFSQSALLPTDRHVSVGQITPSPLTPVPLRHSSLYQVLKQEYPASPTLGTLQSGVSSIAHALEPQEPLARHAPPLCTPVVGNSRDYTIGASASESALSASHISTTSLAVVAGEPCPPLPQAHPPVSSATPPCASVPAQSRSVVTPLQAHTLVPSLPEVTTHDYDTFPRLRKVSSPAPPKCMPYPYVYERALASFSSIQSFRDPSRK